MPVLCCCCSCCGEAEGREDRGVEFRELEWNVECVFVFLDCFTFSAVLDRPNLVIETATREASRMKIGVKELELCRMCRTKVAGSAGVCWCSLLWCSSCCSSSSSSSSPDQTLRHSSLIRNRLNNVQLLSGHADGSVRNIINWKMFQGFNAMRTWWLMIH